MCAEFFAEETDEFAALGSRDVAPLEEGCVRLSDGFGGFDCSFSGDLGDDFAGDWGADRKIACGNRDA